STIWRASSAATTASREGTKSTKHAMQAVYEAAFANVAAPRVFAMSRRRVSLILQSLDERAVHRRLRRPECGNECRPENGRHERQHGAVRKLVGEPHASDVLLDDLQKIKQTDRTEDESERQTDAADAQRLEPDRSPDLSVQAADGLKHTQLASSVGDRHRERVDDAEDRHEHGDRDLDRRQAEPLARDSEDVALQLGVREDEELSFAGKA